MWTMAHAVVVGAGVRAFPDICVTGA